MDGDNFYVVLPSNVNAEEFPNNTISHYYTPLPSNLNLKHGQWEVALVEITYPHSWENMYLPFSDVLFISPELYETKIVKIPNGYYASARDIAKKLDELKPDFFKGRFTWDTDDNKMKIALKEKEGIHFRGRLAKMLGFNDPLVYNNSPRKSIFMPTFPVDIHANLHSIYVYTNIVKKTVVGITHVPLLRVINVRGEHGDHIQKTYINPFYVPLQTPNIKHIEISLCDDLGKNVRFQYGRVILYLHFRKKKFTIWGD
jgi:hypothetical protein